MGLATVVTPGTAFVRQLGLEIAGITA